LLTPQYCSMESSPARLGEGKLGMSKEALRGAKTYRVIVQHGGTYTVEIADGLGVVKKKKGFGNRGAAEVWIAAQKPASGDLLFQPLT
jgi:hypothetical protein